jgi:hypothetical protein
VPYLVTAVAPVGRFDDEAHLERELVRLGDAFEATCQSPEPGELVSHIVEIIRDLAWAIDEVTGSDEHSRWLIEHGSFRTWSVDGGDEDPARDSDGH